MQNSGLKEKSEAAACVHSRASLGSAPECANAHLLHACADALQLTTREDEVRTKRHLSTGQ